MQIVCCLCSGITIYLMVRYKHLQLPTRSGKLTDSGGRAGAASHDERVHAHPLGAPVRFLHRRLCLSCLSGDRERLG